MKIAIILGKERRAWGGDYQALEELKRGIESLDQGIQISLEPSSLKIDKKTLVFFSNVYRYIYDPLLSRIGARYGFLPFYEDYPAFIQRCMGFFFYTENQVIKAQSLKQREGALDRLMHTPEVVRYFARTPNTMAQTNIIPQLLKAKVFFTTSPKEQKDLKELFPHHPSYHTFWNVGMNSKAKEVGEDFLPFTGLKKGEYILQVGRLEPRKNQLATILASRNLSCPLVFIATENYFPSYASACLKAALQLRRAPTIFVLQNEKSLINRHLRVISMGGEGKILPKSMVLSAIKHCGLFVNPAYYELPGLASMEALQFSRPMVLSKEGAVLDYCQYKYPSFLEDSKEYVTFVEPNDIASLEKAFSSSLGKKGKDFSYLPIFKRTRKDVATDFLEACKLLQRT